VRRSFLASLTVALVSTALAAWLAFPYVKAAALVIDLSGMSTPFRRLLPVRVQPVSWRDVSVPTRYGPVPARLYLPADTARRTLALFPGVHSGGVDEPRLAAFAWRLAATGVNVLSMPLPELRRYRLTPVSTDTIEDGATWLLADRRLAPDGHIGLAGVSFAGGLALVAAGRPSLVDRIDLIVALGGHADLPRVMTYLCTGKLADGSVRPPHDYGIVITLLAAIPHLVPPEQARALHQTVLDYLDASSASSTDEARSITMFADVQRATAALAEPSRTLMTMVNDRNVQALGPKLLPYIEELGGFPALSPDRSPPAKAPVFLLHGSEDNVIPSQETPFIASYLQAHGNSRVEWLLTPLLSHANVKPAGAVEAWKLIAFWKQVLSER
jgi:hypothetical protein